MCRLRMKSGMVLLSSIPLKDGSIHQGRDARPAPAVVLVLEGCGLVGVRQCTPKHQWLKHAAALDFFLGGGI